MMASARSATELQVLLRSDDDDRAPLSSSELRLLRASAGDWCSTLFLVGLGFYLDKFVPPFERSVVPQLHDPDISYPHTPSNSAHVPVSHLYLFAFALPLVAVVGSSLSYFRYFFLIAVAATMGTTYKLRPWVRMPFSAARRALTRRREREAPPV